MLFGSLSLVQLFALSFQRQGTWGSKITIGYCLLCLSFPPPGRKDLFLPFREGLRDMDCPLQQQTWPSRTALGLLEQQVQLSRALPDFLPVLFHSSTTLFLYLLLIGRSSQASLPKGSKIWFCECGWASSVCELAACGLTQFTCDMHHVQHHLHSSYSCGLWTQKQIQCAVVCGNLMGCIPANARHKKTT